MRPAPRLPALLFTALMLACGGGQPPADAPIDTTAQAGAAPDTVAIPDTVPLVVLEQEGGLAGGHAELTVHRTGEVTLAQEPAPGGIPVRRWTIAQSDYDALAALLAGAEFRALGAEYLPDDTCCDRITYTITVPGAAAGRTIRTMDGAQQPEVLVTLLERLRALEAAAPQ